jgi:hypothetical protein
MDDVRSKEFESEVEQWSIRLERKFRAREGREPTWWERRDLYWEAQEVVLEVAHPQLSHLIAKQITHNTGETT